MDGDQGSLAASAGLTGTPLYMSPEAIQNPLGVDHRGDLYALGAVGCFLLTGKAVFEATSIVDLCRQHVDTPATSPALRLGKPFSPELETAILACLEKSRAKRPQTARDLAQMLSRVVTAGEWTVEQADAWWGRHERGRSQAQSGPGQPTSASRGHEQTLMLPGIAAPAGR